MPGYDDRVREDHTMANGAVYIAMLIVIVAFGALVWNFFVDEPDAPHIAAPAGDYKHAPASPDPTALDLAEQSARDVGVPSRSEGPTLALGPSNAQAAPANPRGAASGPYVAQLAALQNEAEAAPAWQRLASRAPDLFASVTFDVARADLGARGVFYRVRAGYFPDRAGAEAFCERVRRLGQACIASAR